jgi:predicted RNA methylase
MKKALKELERGYLKTLLRRLQRWRQVTYGDVRVHYKRYLDGGGSSFGQEYIPFLHDRAAPRQGRVFEWCCGPGFIGFSLLGFGLCDTLCLADINPQAVTACRRTIVKGGLSGRVKVYQSDNLANIPRSEQWDLVVGNPPHFDRAGDDLRFWDEGWRIHRQFFGSVNAFLKPGGLILLQENNHGSTAETFREMIEQAELSIVHVHNCETRVTPYQRLYLLGIMRQGDTPPGWLRGSADRTV